MIRLSGLRLGEDIEIVFTGLRPGEKLFEELLHESEKLGETSHPKLLLAQSRKIEWDYLENQLKKLQIESLSRNVPQVIDLLREVVPEFKPPV